jgi:hypothetical protein
MKSIKIAKKYVKLKIKFAVENDDKLFHVDNPE